MSHEKVLCICEETSEEQNCAIYNIQKDTGEGSMKTNEDASKPDEDAKNIFDTLDDLTARLQKHGPSLIEESNPDGRLVEYGNKKKRKWTWEAKEGAYCYYVLLFDKEKHRVRKDEILASQGTTSYWFEEQIEYVRVFTLFEQKNRDCSKYHRFMIIRKAGGNEYEMIIDLLSRVRQQDRSQRRRCEVYFGFLRRPIPDVNYEKSDRVALKQEVLGSNNHDRVRDEVKYALEVGGQYNIKYLTHTNIEDSSKDVWIAMELCCMDTLNTLIVKKKKEDDSYMIDCKKMKVCFRHVLLGLSHLHSKNVAHGEMIIENILLSLDKLNLKIGDYDHVKQVEKSEHFSSTQKDLKMTAIVFFMCIRRNVKDNSEKRFREWASSMKTNLTENIPIPNTIIPSLINTNTEEDKVSIHCPQILPTILIQIADTLKKAQDSPDPYLSGYLILHMVLESKNIKAESVLKHPFFWDEFKILSFISRVDAFLHSPPQKSNEEKHAAQEVRSILEAYVKSMWPEFDWMKKCENSLDSLKEKHPKKMNAAITRVKQFAENLLKDHDRCAITGLLRLIRNVHNHYHTSRKEERVFATSDEVWDFFNKMYPGMICLVHRTIWERLDSNSELPDDLRRFFERSDYNLDLSKLEDLIE